MREDYVHALVAAHYARDEDRFRTLVLQAASHVRDSHRRASLIEATKRGLVALPVEAKGVVVPLEPVDLGTLVLDERVADDLTMIAKEHDHCIALRERGLPPRNRLLFWGPPGNGKSSCAAALADVLGCSAFAAHLPGLVSSFMGDTSSRLEKAFSVLRAGCVLVLDEIDAIGSERHRAESGSGREYNTIVATMLSLLDREQNGVLVATTNRPDILDPALRRRFSCELEFAAPSAELRCRCARRLSERYGLKERYGVELPIPDSATSFDAVTKYVQAQARAAVLLSLGTTPCRAGIQ